LMTQEEWTALDEEFFKQDLELRRVVALVPWAAYGVPREVLDRVFADSGLGFKLVWLATRRRFARREERAFRYACATTGQSRSEKRATPPSAAATPMRAPTPALRTVLEPKPARPGRR